MKRKLISLTLAVIFLITAVPFLGISATAEEKIDGKTITILKETTYEGYSASSMFDNVTSSWEDRWCDMMGSNSTYVVFKTRDQYSITKMIMESETGESPRKYSLAVLKDENAYNITGDKDAYLADKNNYQIMTTVTNLNPQKATVTTDINTNVYGSIYRIDVLEGQEEGNEWANIVELSLYGVKSNVETVTVSFDAAGGTGTMNSIYVVKGSRIALPSCDFIGPDGMDFDCFLVSGERKQPGEEITVNSNITIQAVWKTATNPSEKIKGITVLDASGSTNDRENPQLAFDGDYETKWCDNNTGDRGWIAFSTPTPKIIEKIKVTHAEGHGNDHKENNTIAFSLQVLKNNVTMPRNPNHEFLNNDDNFVDIIKVNNSVQNAVTENTVSGAPKAQYYRLNVTDGDGAVNWSAVRIYEIELFGTSDYKDPVNITFDKNTGTGTMGAVTIEKSSSYTLPSCDFLPPEGYEFKAWEVNGSAKQPGNIITVNDNITVKALWHKLTGIHAVKNITVIGKSGQVNTGERAELAFDGDYETKWCDNSNGDRGWIVFSTPTPKIIEKIKVTHAEGHGDDYKENNTIAFSLQVLKENVTMPQNPSQGFLSNDNNFVDIVSVDNSEQKAVTENMITGAPRTNYYRFKVTDGDYGSSGGAVRIYEIELFGIDQYENPVEITYDAAEGTGATTKTTVEKGTEITLPSCVFTPPADYKFKAWEVDGAEKQPGDKITVNVNKTVKALWQKINYVNITFDKNTGTGTMDSLRIEKNTEFTLPSCTFTPPEDYEFKAWEVDGAEKQPEDKIILNGDKVIKVLWQKINYINITFDKGGADGGEMPDVKWNARLEYTLPQCEFTHSSGKFINWIVDGVNKNPQDTIILTKDTVIKANWKYVKYVNVIFDANGGSGTMETERIDSKNIYKLPDNKFSYDNKRFIGWEINGEYREVCEEIFIDEDITVKAIWQDIVNVNITFDANGGTGEMPPVTHDKNIKYYTPLCRFTAPQGKVFAGWLVGSDTTAYPERQPVNIKGDTLIKPLWKTYGEMGLKEQLKEPLLLKSMESVDNLATYGYKWDKENNKLIINGLNMSCNHENAIFIDNLTYEDPDITIIVEGNNVIRNMSDAHERETAITSGPRLIIESENNGKLTLSSEGGMSVNAFTTKSDNNSLRLIISGGEYAVNVSNSMNFNGGVIDAYGRIALTYAFYGMHISGNTILRAFGEDIGIDTHTEIVDNKGIKIYTNRIMNESYNVVLNRETMPVSIFQEDNAYIKKSFIYSDMTYNDYTVKSDETIFIKPEATVTFTGNSQNNGVITNKGILNNSGKLVNNNKINDMGTIEGNPIEGNAPLNKNTVDVTYIGKDGTEVTEKAIPLQSIAVGFYNIDSNTYVVKGDVTLDSRVTINNSTKPCKIILEDGAKLTIYQMLQNSGTVEIYGQKEGTGKISRTEKDTVYNMELDNLSVYGGRIESDIPGNPFNMEITGKTDIKAGNVKAWFIGNQCEVNGGNLSIIGHVNRQANLSNLVVNTGTVNIEGKVQIKQRSNPPDIEAQIKNVNGTINNAGDIHIVYDNIRNAQNYVKSLKLSGTKGRVYVYDSPAYEENYIVYDNSGHYGVHKNLFTDPLFLNYVETNFDTDKDKILSDEEILNAQRIDVSNIDNINNVYGFEVFTNVKYINFNGKINMENYTVPESLEELHCRNTVMRNIDLTNAKNLTTLDCAYTSVSELDLSKTPKLKFLDVFYTLIGTLDIRNLNLDKLVVNSGIKNIVINDNQRLFNVESNIANMKTDENATFINNTVKFKSNRVEETVCNIKEKIGQFKIINADYIPYAPKDFAVTNSIGSAKGKVTGVSDIMEYRKAGDTNWIDILGTEINNLDLGTYEIREKAEKYHIAGDIAEFSILKEQIAPTNIEGKFGIGTNVNTVKFTVTAKNGCEYSLDGKVWQNENIFDNLTPKNYTFYIRTKASGDVIASKYKSKEFTFTKFDVNCTVKSKNFAYGEEIKTFETTKEREELTFDKFLYSVRGENNFTKNIPENAGLYTVKALFKGTTVFNDQWATADFEITKAKNPLKVKLGRLKANLDGTVDIDLYFENNMGIENFDFQLLFDELSLDILSVKSENNIASFDDTTNTISYSGSGKYKANGKVLTICGKILDKTKFTSIEILDTENNFTAVDKKNMDFIYEKGMVSYYDGFIAKQNTSEGFTNIELSFIDSFINNEVTVVLGFYKDNDLVDKKIVKANVLKGKANVKIPVSDKVFDKTKVMVFENLTNIRPLTYVK